MSPRYVRGTYASHHEEIQALLADDQADGFAHLPAWGSSTTYDSHGPDDDDEEFNVPMVGGTAWDEHDPDELAPY